MRRAMCVIAGIMIIWALPPAGCASNVRGTLALIHGLLIDGMAASTGDDTALLMSHTHGSNAPEVHEFAWNTFAKQAEVAAAEGHYGAG